eukprot:RCo008144
MPGPHEALRARRSALLPTHQGALRGCSSGTGAHGEAVGHHMGRPKKQVLPVAVHLKVCDHPSQHAALVSEQVRSHGHAQLPAALPHGLPAVHLNAQVGLVLVGDAAVVQGVPPIRQVQHVFALLHHRDVRRPHTLQHCRVAKLRWHKLLEKPVGAAFPFVYKLPHPFGSQPLHRGGLLPHIFHHELAFPVQKGRSAGSPARVRGEGLHDVVLGALLLLLLHDLAAFSIVHVPCVQGAMLVSDRRGDGHVRASLSGVLLSQQLEQIDQRVVNLQGVRHCSENGRTKRPQDKRKLALSSLPLELYHPPVKAKNGVVNIANTCTT